MEKVVVIRYGELFLKGKNRDYFESLLIRNVKSALQGVDCTFQRSQGRYFVENFDEDDCGEILQRLSRVFGIHSLSVADKVAVRSYEDFPEIRASLAQAARKAAENAQGKLRFRVTVKRADKRIPMTSAEIAAALGGTVLSLGGFKVDLTSYDCDFKVDIRENGFALVYTDVFQGAGGLPVGCSGRGMLLLSGGIDSPVAAYMMAKRGMKIFAVHFASPPYTSEKAREKVLELRDIVTAYAGGIRLFVVPFTEIQLAIHKNCPANYMITIMRRFMMRIACRLAETYDCGAVITGESLGQVASQTVESMTCTGDTATLPVFRPLIGMDKDEIMTLAKKIGTYETSIQPYEDCCTVFLPKSPAIHPSLDSVRKAEAALDVEALTEAALAAVEEC
ncbi:MAG TPA: tRNA 4-thiouridine(8) synthase ThiI [Candidatus Limadaptatus stercorigallinarum]|uniref:Probable tRNA sulfurtransferase n=1 Tax=Candidatus Limadaptatus stercorigallinarum TaxID=2840845 RepID=A0A9D1HRS7_9FIRM|nr:tRNA 4-thiouridine(8) synthase ThiI [Candidatus Limadaptatus stercorigallinarum]